MLVIGLTGNFGTGKTTISQMLAELGAVIINADELGHELLQPDSQTHKEIVAAFGKSILKSNGEVDRNKLAKLVFDDTTALAQLNQITHPKIYEIVKHKIEEYRHTGAKVVVLEAALLIEAGWTPLVNQVWVTVAPEATVVRRLQSSRVLTEEQVLARLHSQMPQVEKAKQADVVIDTDCSLDALRTKISELLT
jgi:dephospho-CoA kinase